MAVKPNALERIEACSGISAAPCDAVATVSRQMSPTPDLSAWFEAVWAQREDQVYRALFGNLGEGVIPASPATYERYQKKPHPGWLHHAVFACPPDGERTHWLYITSGLSNPWNLEQPSRDVSGYAGLGFELAIATPTPQEFAPKLLHNLMAYELLVATGQYPGAELFEYGNRIPLRGSITPEFESKIRWLLVEQPKHYKSSFDLPPGRVDLFHLVGATDAEIELGNVQGQDPLVAMLQQHGAHPVTDAARLSCC
ncbi:MAG: suppressor of fused domain protein [Planctomycetes bacterium]|nr:suppressor of fused domain protein [Planctomycetota bacterium]